MFSHFDTIPECVRQTHTQIHTETHDDGIYSAGIASCGENYMSLEVLELTESSVVKQFATK